MREFLDIVKALADENRLRILMMLQGGELCVCQIIGMLGLAQSTVSKHMLILRHARLVDTRKEGRWMYYRLSKQDTTKTTQKAMRWVRRHLTDDRTVQHDVKQLKKVVGMDKKDLCKKLSKK